MLDLHRSRARVALTVWLLLLVAAMAGCSRGSSPTPAPAPTGAALDSLPDNNAVVLVRPEDGGTVGLRDGAQLALPRQSLTNPTLVTLRALSEVPSAPIPRSIVGRAYDVSLDGGDLIGVGTLTMPLAASVSPGQYDLGVYRWDGRAWERVEGRVDSQYFRVGINQPGTYAVLGAWHMADAALTLSIPAPQPGSDSVPAEVRGQYRYTALPTMQHDYVEARLTLKRDSSGGAGQIAGNDQLDATVAETVLWFKPDPTQSQGIIDFNYTFQMNPAALDVPLGSINHFYAVLSVADSPAPTRRLSTAADYAVQLPIKAMGTDVVRPEVTGSQQPMFWHVRLNGQTLLREPATQLTLSLAELLSRGGLGEYKITVDVEYQGNYQAVSNEVTVQLAVPGTATPATLAQAPATGASPTPTVFPFGTMPPTPTRRAPPNGAPSPLEGPTRPVAVTATSAASEPTATPAATPTPAAANGNDVFWAEDDAVTPGGCTQLHWSVQNVREVYIDDAATTGANTRRVCPNESSTYTLRAIDQAGHTQEWRVSVAVQTNSPSDTTVDYGVDQYQIVLPECAHLNWKATNVLRVFLNGQGVQGEESAHEVCPKTTTTYVLRVEGSEKTLERRLTVYVLPQDSILVRFWADQYTLKANSCTLIHWSVQDVDAVHLRIAGTESGVAGEGEQRVCPSGSPTYSLVVVKSGRPDITKSITLQATDPELDTDEAIAQATVSDITELGPDDDNMPNGFKLTLDSIAPLVRGFDTCCQSRMTVWLSRLLISSQYADKVDWPLHLDQPIEFRLKRCTASECRETSAPPEFYIKARSP